MNEGNMGLPTGGVPEKIKPNNSDLLERILTLYPDLIDKIKVMVLQKLRDEGRGKSIEVEDLIQKSLLIFITTKKSPKEDWAETNIAGWFNVVIGNLIKKLSVQDADLHIHKKRTKTVQFSTPEEVRDRISKSIPVEDELQDKKSLSPLGELLAVESPDNGLDLSAYQEAILHNLTGTHAKIQTAMAQLLSIDNSRNFHKYHPVENHIQEANIKLVYFKNPDLSEEEFTNKVLESIDDRHIDPVLIKKIYYGEENFNQAINSMKNEKFQNIAKWWYIDYFGFGKIARLLHDNSFNAKRLIEKASIELLSLLSIKKSLSAKTGSVN